MPKSLIIYQTKSGNTEKVAIRFKQVFEKQGWECDILKIDEKTDVSSLSNLEGYDFLCVGSGVHGAKCYDEIFNVMFGATHSRDNPEMQRKIVPGPNKGVVFVTYSGEHLGPQEAEPALGLLALELEHLKYRCIGRFSCPGKHVGHEEATPEWWHGDIRDRPNERDLLKAEIFLEDKLEEIFVRSSEQYQG